MKCGALESLQGIDAAKLESIPGLLKGLKIRAHEQKITQECILEHIRLQFTLFLSFWDVQKCLNFYYG